MNVGLNLTPHHVLEDEEYDNNALPEMRMNFNRSASIKKLV